MIWVLGTDGVSTNGVWLARDIGMRIRWVVKQMRDEGRELRLTEGLREPGVPADQYVTDASKTSTGGGNAWFYVGQAASGIISSALPPVGAYVTKHITGRAIDCNAPTELDMQRRSYFMGRVGMYARIAGETWHFEIYDPVDSDIDLAPYSDEGFLMTLNTTEQTDLYNAVVWPNGKQKFKIDAVLVAQSANQASTDKKLDTLLDRTLAPNKKWTLDSENRNRLEIVEKEVDRQGELLNAIADKLGVKLAA